MTTPGDFAALYDALAEVHDRLVARDELLRQEAIPLRSYRRHGESLRADADNGRIIAALEIDAAREEVLRIAHDLDSILQSVFALALLDHNAAVHSDHTAP